MNPRAGTCARGALLGAGMAVLAACTAPAVRPPPPLPPAPPPAPPVADLAPGAPVLPTVVAEPADSPWPKLRRSFAMQRCDYRPDVVRWAEFYTRNPRAFGASWKQAMPFLLLVVDELEKRHLPGEFAMLPYVESTYQPLPSSGDRPAGMWQLVPDTAREAGLAVSPDYDARLDALASTGAALDLLVRYQREFGDWRLVNMAFNSGEFKVRKLLGERDPRGLSADELAALPFNPWTHDHLDRLLALACIVENPGRFGVTLPEPGEDDRLETVTLEAGMDLRFAARVAGLEVDDVKRWNAAYRRNRMDPRAAHRLLLPASHVERFRTASAGVPARLWSDWKEERTTHAGSIAGWAAQAGVPAAVLALANGTRETASVTQKTRLLLPGREPEPTPAERRSGAQRRPRVHVVAAGDTLARIAQRYDIPLKDLRRWNPQASGTLHIGERIRLSLALAETG